MRALFYSISVDYSDDNYTNVIPYHNEGLGAILQVQVAVVKFDVDQEAYEYRTFSQAEHLF